MFGESTEAPMRLPRNSCCRTVTSVEVNQAVPTDPCTHVHAWNGTVELYAWGWDQYCKTHRGKVSVTFYTPIAYWAKCCGSRFKRINIMIFNMSAALADIFRLLILETDEDIPKVLNSEMSLSEDKKRDFCHQRKSSLMDDEGRVWGRWWFWRWSVYPDPWGCKNLFLLN